MDTMAQRIETLRTGRNLSRPALSAALGLPRTAVEKFETGRATPTQAQQEQLAAYFGVSVFYLRGESTDPTTMDDWMDGAFQDPPAPAPAPAPVRRETPASGGEGSVFDAFLSGKRFQEALRAAVLDTLRSPEGMALLDDAVRRAGKGK